MLEVDTLLWMGSDMGGPSTSCPALTGGFDGRPFRNMAGHKIDLDVWSKLYYDTFMNLWTKNPD